MSKAMKIVVDFIDPPIPIRSCDYCAHFDDPEGLYAHGATPREAVENLFDLLDDDGREPDPANEYAEAFDRKCR